MGWLGSNAVSPQSSPPGGSPLVPPGSTPATPEIRDEPKESYDKSQHANSLAGKRGTSRR